MSYNHKQEGGEGGPAIAWYGTVINMGGKINRERDD